MQTEARRYRTQALLVWFTLLAVWTEPQSGSATKPVASPGSAASESKHWAFIPPKRPPIPSVRNPQWVRNPIDAFVLARLEEAGIQPSPEADPITLVRRVYLDLIGLPPSPEEVDDFLRDQRPDAYERLVDRLLASPHYGEKWARHWLDLARYADSDGYETDQLRPYAWRYRQWVIEAFNRDLPFDQFTIYQIAGDLLPNATIAQKIATGFHRNTLSNREGGADLEEYRVEQVADRVATIGVTWLGLGLHCARCHDHKYDPITQKEFYQLFAFFNNAEEVNIEAPLPGELGSYLRSLPEYQAKRSELLRDLSPAIAQLQAEWEAKVREAYFHPGKDYRWDRQVELLGLTWGGNLGWGQLEGLRILLTDPAKRTERQKERLHDYFLKHGSLINPHKFQELKLADLSRTLDQLKAAYPGLTEAPALEENPQPRKTYVHIRGDFRNPGEEVQPGTPAVLHPLPPDPKPSRLTLARWLVSSDNPLTARVTVNRVWQELFGRGIVATSEEFGTRGAKPTHPELLDWLATTFMAKAQPPHPPSTVHHSSTEYGCGWSLKQLLQLIVTSATYRQSSRIRPDLEARFPNNILLARQARLRLPAELIRDSALAVSGLLNPTIGGPSVHPPQPASVSKEGFNNPWPESKGPDRYRRGLYTWIQRTSPFAQLVTFDGADPNRTCSCRERSNTPLQALTLLNDPVFFEAAQALAVRILKEKPGSVQERIAYAFRLALARSPKPKELEILFQYYNRQMQLLEREPESAAKIFPARLEGISPLEAACWTGVASILLNLDEFITRE